MHTLKTTAAVLRNVLLGATLVVGGACGIPEDMQALDGAPALDEQSAALLPPCAPPPADQTVHDGILFHLYTTTTTWNAAKADCEAMGGRLAVPTGPARNEVIRNLNNGSDPFIGLMQLSGQSSTSTGWVTVSGNTPGYLNWNPGEPNDMDGYENGHQNCSRMYISDGEWDDVSCTTTSPYICEFPVPPTRCTGGATCTLSSGTYSCQ
jgi:Lectin C-type domain